MDVGLIGKEASASWGQAHQWGVPVTQVKWRSGAGHRSGGNEVERKGLDWAGVCTEQSASTLKNKGGLSLGMRQSR